jgi:hypothetical protein
MFNLMPHVKIANELVVLARVGICIRHTENLILPYVQRHY